MLYFVVSGLVTVEGAFLAPGACWSLEVVVVVAVVASRLVWLLQVL
jgi:hypothetical protein